MTTSATGDRTRRTARAVVACVVLTGVPVVCRVLPRWPPPMPFVLALAVMPVVSLLLVHDLDQSVKNRALRILLLFLGILDLLIPFSLLIMT